MMQYNKSPVKNIFTIDTEDWFHSNLKDNISTENLQSTICENVDVYLKHFSDYHVKATFFVLGIVAEKHPQLIRDIASEGHEIACHGYGHQLVYKQTPKQFREDVRKAKKILEDLIGKGVLGYRAPSWSITEKSLWALDILEEEGFRYTSSIFPTKNFLFGIPYAPRFPHTHGIYGKKNLKLIQIPPSTFSCLGINVPFSGGAYFRVLPFPLIQHFTKSLNKQGHAVVFYLHPREIDPKQPRFEMPFRDRLIQYYGIGGCEKKLIKVLSRFTFETMQQFLEENAEITAERELE